VRTAIADSLDGRPIDRLAPSLRYFDGKNRGGIAMTVGSFKGWKSAVVIGIAAFVWWAGGARPASAQIYEWRDAVNDRHFSTSLDDVPDDMRASAKLVVDGPRAETSAEAMTPMTEPTEPDDTAQASDASDDKAAEPLASGWDAGFDAGWEAAMRAAADQQPECSTEPQVVVLQSQPPVVVGVPAYDPTGAYYQSPYQGTVTVPFDDGASRGLTRRELVQQARAFERGW
jgi:hypothetical protein